MYIHTMKNEDRIIELLAESLQRLDRMEEGQTRIVEVLNRQTLVMDKMLDTLVSLNSEVKDLNRFVKNEMLVRIERLEEAVFKKGA